jgi:hypothetical protein
VYVALCPTSNQQLVVSDLVQSVSRECWPTGMCQRGALPVIYCHVQGVVACLITRRGSDWIPDLFAMEIIATHGYNYNEHYSTSSFSDPTDGTALR